MAKVKQTKTTEKEPTQYEYQYIGVGDANLPMLNKKVKPGKNIKTTVKINHPFYKLVTEK